MVEKIIWSATAREDLSSIAAYVAQDNFSRAEPYCLELIEFAESAGDFPRLGRIVPELEDPNVREIIKPPYRIIYEIFPDQPRPVIMRVWHGARGTPAIIRPSSP
jgi:plasmid stabilization system protein ParE